MRDIYKYVLFLVIVLTILFLACSEAPDEARVIDVIDGDTIQIDNGQIVRYIGINAPEKGDYGYSRATEKNEELVLGKMISLEKDISDKDKYGRLLRYVYTDGIFVNSEMVRSGYALSKSYPPDTKYQVFLEAVESEAILNKNGIWCED